MADLLSNSQRKQFAAALGITDRELVAVEASPAGPIVTTFDGVQYVLVQRDDPPEGAPVLGPDTADGTPVAVLLLRAPTPDYTGTFPIYEQPGALLPLEKPSPEELAAEVERTEIGEDRGGGAPQPIADPPNPDEQPGKQVDAVPEAVPVGTADAVIAWVGTDPARAAAALEVEEKADHPRSSLVGSLRKLAKL